MIEIFSHDVTFSPDPDEPDDIFIISGKGWEGEPFKLYLRKSDAEDLIWQMTYYVHNPEYD